MTGMKRLAVSALWGYAFWYAGAMLASIFSGPEVFGPILGIAAGLLVGIDPRGLFWATAKNPDRVARRLEPMAHPEGAR